MYKFYAEDGERKILGIEGKQASPGISSFASDPKSIGSYITPLLKHSESIIPKNFHNFTEVFVKATAGYKNT